MKTILILLIFAVVIVLILNLSGPSGPAEFVKNRTVETYSNLLFNYEIIRYPSSAEITPAGSLNGSIILGFVTDSWNINFGSVPANGSYVTRSIKLSNIQDKDASVMLRSYGNVSSLIDFGNNDFFLKPAENVSVDIFMNSKNFPVGNYSGEIDVIIKKPIYNFLPIN